MDQIFCHPVQTSGVDLPTRSIANAGLWWEAAARDAITLADGAAQTGQKNAQKKTFDMESKVKSTPLGAGREKSVGGDNCRQVSVDHDALPTAHLCPSLQKCVYAIRAN